MRLRTPRLDFIVIGAQKAGTTSLWRYLQDNEAVRMPPDKEASFFSEPAYPADLRGYLRALFRDAPRGAMLGTVTPVYMHGTPGAPVPVIAERIRETAPSVKLIALLRDPVARAFSAHRMMSRRGADSRSFDEAIGELLGPEQLDHARAMPDETNSYIVAGEYGRMLAAYLERFGRDQLLVVLSAELARSPAAVVARVCRFLGVEPHTPGEAGRRFYAGGPPLLPRDAERDLKDYLEQNVWPRLRHAEQHRERFRQWFELWNVVPEPPSSGVADETAATLRAHYEEDASLLAEAIGVRVPHGV
ncbi:MAG TPA: sulfotransferase [Thermoleophilaceae bacterium]|nr:sulfotransferase [Thermoleophilaceae bacterium]